MLEKLLLRCMDFLLLVIVMAVFYADLKAIADGDAQRIVAHAVMLLVFGYYSCVCMRLLAEEDQPGVAE